MNATRRTSILGCTFLASVLGCDRPSVPSAVTLRDSSGVRITEIDWEAVPESSALVQREELSAGALLELHEVRDAIRLSDGSVVIVEASTQEAIWLGSDGELIRRIGGRGDGPEQFRGLSRVFEADDADLILLDSTRKRYVRLDREGGIVEGGQGPVTIGAIFTGHHTADGEWYLLTSGPMEETGIARNSGSDQVAIVRRPRLALIRARFDGSGAVDSITTILGTESALGPASMGILGFGATAVSAGGREGVWIGDTRVAEVKLWTTQEGPARIVRWKETNSRAVDESVIDALWLDLAALTSPEELKGMRAVLPLSEEIPAFEGLVVGDDDKLWIGGYASYMSEVFQAPQKAQEWVVLDFEAGVAEKLTTPPGLRVLRAGHDYVLGVHRDELGVESVRLYGLSPR